MKKALVIMLLTIACGQMAFAQQKVVKNETKVKKTTTIPEKVHNTFSKHKHYKGTKVKHVKKTEKK